MVITSNQEKTQERKRALNQYFEQHVLLGVEMVCKHKDDCKRSHSGKGLFYEGQLHHVGQHYDLSQDGIPFRVIVVGQEYGHGPEHRSCEARYKDFIPQDHGRYKVRNPHMRGTVNVLRLLFDQPGEDYDSEFLSLSGERYHLFDAFALVDYLLCSAVPSDGTTRGMGTEVMKRNCREHFRRALEILEPVVIVVQGKIFWRTAVRHAFDGINRESHWPPEVYVVKLGPVGYPLDSSYP